MIDGRGIGWLYVRGNLLGGDGAGSGRIFSGGDLKQVTIGGSVIGGSRNSTGVISGSGVMGLVRIGHDLRGGSIANEEHGIVDSGLILSTGSRVDRIEIGGSIIAGADTSTAGGLLRCGAIRAMNQIGSLTVRGSIIGNVNPLGESRVVISARGQQEQGDTTDLAIGRIVVGGNLEWTQILGGYNLAYTPAPDNPDAQIGTVTVFGDWVASDLIAGVDGNGDGFVDINDSKITGGITADSPSIVSKIGAITIMGLAIGTLNSVNDSDHFGIAAQQVDSITVGQTTRKFVAGPANNGIARFIALTLDLSVWEVGL
jgi:hypothetical protein